MGHLYTAAKPHLSNVEPIADDSVSGLGISLCPLQVVRVVVSLLDPHRVGRVEVELGVVGFCCSEKVGDKWGGGDSLSWSAWQTEALTGDVERARRRSYAIADSALVGAVVCGFQLELQLRRLLQVWHGHTDELAITQPANVS